MQPRIRIIPSIQVDAQSPPTSSLSTTQIPKLSHHKPRKSQNQNQNQKQNTRQTMDFAPYQDVSPETSRALSPPPIEEGRRSFSPSRRSFSPALGSPTKVVSPGAGVGAWGAAASTAGNFGNDGHGGNGYFGETGNGGGNGAWGGNAGDAEAGRIGRLNEFETSLPIRLDYEACLAYLLLPPAGGVLLLMFERKSDYVR